MNKEWELTPMELVFCGKLLNAKYIDYDYFAAMPDIQIQRELREQETLEKLEEDGIIETDFYGNVTFGEDVKEVLMPIFFGEVESRLEIDGQPVYRFHIHQGNITMTVLQADIVSLKKIEEDEEIKKLLIGKSAVIQCANIRSGQKNMILSSEKMKEKDKKNQAVNMLKGEVKDDE